MWRRLSCIFTVFIMFLELSGPTAINASNVPSISAKAAVLIEAQTGKVIYEKNSTLKLSMASTTKIMTVLLCLESGNLDEEFTVDPEAIKVEGSSMGLREGDIVSKRDLCIGMLLPSGNDAANATAVHIAGSIEKFAEMMNERAAQIGMTRTCFVTPSGLEAPGHGTSAYDMSLLAREAMKNEDFREICCKKSMKLSFGNPPYERWLKNTNKLLAECDGVNGVKTGFTDEAGRCLVSSCERNGVSLICVTLNDPSDRVDHAALYNYGFSCVTSEMLSSGEHYVSVVGGDKDKIKVSSHDTIKVGVINGETPVLEEKEYIDHFIYAPAEAGTYVGYVDYYCDGIFVCRRDMYTESDADFYQTNDNFIKRTIRNIKKVLSRK